MNTPIESLWPFLPLEQLQVTLNSKKEALAAISDEELASGDFGPCAAASFLSSDIQKLEKLISEKCGDSFLNEG